MQKPAPGMELAWFVILFSRDRAPQSAQREIWVKIFGRRRRRRIVQ
jgi:hypothetical protein